MRASNRRHPASRGRWRSATLLVLTVLAAAQLAQIGAAQRESSAASAFGADRGIMRGALEAAGASPVPIMQAQLNSGASVDARWNPCQDAITYQVNLDGLPVHGHRAMLAKIRRSFQKLHAATGMTYRYRGVTDFVPQQDNLAEQPAEIVVAAVPRQDTDIELTERSLGYGGALWSTWYGPQGEGAAIMRGYVLLEATAIQELRGGWGRGNRQTNVILHELAHASGLGHADSSREQMFPTLSPTSPAGYRAGDRAALARVGVEAGCIDVPQTLSLQDLD